MTSSQEVNEEELQALLHVEQMDLEKPPLPFTLVRKLQKLQAEVLQLQQKQQ